MNSKQREHVIKDALEYKTPIFAMYCLDEGISIPELQSAVIVSSSSSTRQYIQRRGRILRSGVKNKIANLYDLVVLPKYSLDPKYNSILKEVILSEERRLTELASCAENKWGAINEFNTQVQNLQNLSELD